MKKNLTLALLMLSGLAVHAQNIQLHYDFGRNIYSSEQDSRDPITVTFENFAIDSRGSWFYFIDLDINKKLFKGVYTEISREYFIGKSPFAAHIEYNGGMNRNTSFQHAALVGPAWNGHSADYSKTYSVQLLYKHFFAGESGTHSYSSVQLTGVWNLNFFNKALTFSGYIDFWRGEDADRKGKLVILAEPQLWLNLAPFFNGEKLSIGTELEFSNNFIYNEDPTSSKTCFINPTLALKWNF